LSAEKNKLAHRRPRVTVSVAQILTPEPRLPRKRDGIAISISGYIRGNWPCQALTGAGMRNSTAATLPFLAFSTSVDPFARADPSVLFACEQTHRECGLKSALSC
jgi:hypothetical protein